jgi:hypothetical protein
MHEPMHVFSKVVRACPGKLMELQFVTAAMAQRFATLHLSNARRTVSDMRPLDD